MKFWDVVFWLGNGLAFMMLLLMVASSIIVGLGTPPEELNYYRAALFGIFTVLMIIVVVKSLFWLTDLAPRLRKWRRE